MEMEMPSAEELEWLETHSLLPEEDGREGGGEEEEEEEEKLPEQQQCGHFSSPPNPSTGTRKRVREEEVEMDDEESPSRSTSASARIKTQQQQFSQRSEEIRLSRFASEIQGPCFPITGPSGHRLYAKLTPNPLPKPVASPGAARLLPQSIRALNQRAENNAFSKALQESLQSIGTAQTPPPQAAQTEQLWVDKYAPCSFTDLLSDEHTNREVLLWLKQWDSLVFGSHVRATSDDVLSALRMHSSATQTTKFPTNRGFFSKRHRSISSNDQNGNCTTETGKSNGQYASRTNKCLLDKPPEQKVLLLCGTPGLGKTTLAHVAAKHCGYRVVEINASDDRSASSIEAKILDVVQMDSVMPDSKPKCLVIDEIDGALGDGKGAVEVILKMVAAERKSSSEKKNVDGEAQGQGQAQKATSKKGHKVAKLSRPVGSLV